MRRLGWLTLAVALLGLFACSADDKKSAKKKAKDRQEARDDENKATGEPSKPVNVVMETSLGTIELELYPDKAPITVKNFLGYVDDKFYDGTVFHRVIPNFMIQGGGFEKGMQDAKDAKAFQ